MAEVGRIVRKMSLRPSAQRLPRSHLCVYNLDIARDMQSVRRSWCDSAMSDRQWCIDSARRSERQSLYLVGNKARRGGRVAECGGLL